MKRRDLLIGAGALLVLGVRDASPQPARKPARIGVLSSTSPETRSVFWEKFKEAMASHGWTEGRDVTYVYRYARGDPSRFDAYAAELAGEKPDVMFAATQGAAAALKRASRTIPIVFAHVSDPVAAGLVATLARPGGNVTGVSSQATVLAAKGIELLAEIVPRAKRIGLLLNDKNDVAAAYRETVAKAAAQLKLTLVTATASRPDQLEPAVQLLAREGAQAVMVMTDPMMLIERRSLNALLQKARLPAAFGNRDHVRDGALLSYAPDIGANFRLAAGYVDRILKGAKPADLPVEQSDTFELVINMKTAKALGIAIPPAVLARAHEVIE